MSAGRTMSSQTNHEHRTTPRGAPMHAIRLHAFGPAENLTYE
jgi:NADPH2:quinone reductase